MTKTAEKIEVKVKVSEDGTKRWNHLFLIQDGDVRKVFVVFDIEEDEVYIQYDTVALSVNGKFEEYELTHEEEEAVKFYISENYGTVR